MDPQESFCHNELCWAYGRAGEGHLVIHGQKEQRYKCKRCGQTFSATKGTPLYRMHKPHELVTIVVTLLAYGCPVQAIVAAFGLDERTIQRDRGLIRARSSSAYAPVVLSRPFCFAPMGFQATLRGR